MTRRELLTRCASVAVAANVTGLTLEVVEIPPNGLVVLQCPHALTHEGRAHLKRLWDEAAPGTRAIVLDSGVTAHVLQGTPDA